VPEQEFPPPHRLARPYRPDRDDEEPPPWANMPSVRPARSGRHAGPGDPVDPGRPGGPSGPGGPGSRSAGTGGPSGGPGRPEGPGGGYGGPGPHPGGPPAPGGTDLRDHPGPRRFSDPDRAESAPPWAQWAGPEPDAGAAAPPPRTRAPGGRALRAAARRRRRWFFLGGVVVVVAGAVLAVVLLTGGGPGPAAVTPGALITTFQPGELRQVPDACHVVPAAIVQQYLPGTPKVAAPLPVDGSAASACNWTVDKPPLYRLMQVNLTAYAPNGLASGNGSATRAATDAYDLARQDLQAPPKGFPASQATVQVLSGFGDQAFSALQVFHVGGAVTDVATVMVRDRNVVVAVTLNALEHSNKGNYGPVSKTQLAAAAMAFARAAEGSLH
jgi:hypothetical protein